MNTKYYIKSNIQKALVAFCALFLYIFLCLLMMGCANVSKVQEKEGWFPVGMDEDGQSFYNSKYNTLDNGYTDPNMNIKVFNTKY